MTLSDRAGDKRLQRKRQASTASLELVMSKRVFSNWKDRSVQVSQTPACLKLALHVTATAPGRLCKAMATCRFYSLGFKGLDFNMRVS